MFSLCSIEVLEQSVVGTDPHTVHDEITRN
uniref:Uncharacterized protein n=1 Tax=Rhizophora mucronata TaxID=61149 RepID=A0A2P2NBQ7_RHIMU